MMNRYLRKQVTRFLCCLTITVIFSVVCVNGLCAQNTAIAYYKTGNAKYRNKNFKGAIVDYTQAITLQPNYTKIHDIYYWRGRARSKIADHNGAIVDYNKAILLKPNFTNAYYRRGVANYQEKNYDLAIADYTQSLQLAPNYANTYFRRGRAKIKTKDYDGAIVDYNKVLELKPKYASASTVGSLKGKITIMMELLLTIPAPLT